MATIEELQARKQREALEVAIKILDAQGCKYKVITADGAEFGVLEVAPERKRARRRDLSHFGYPEKVRAMKVGDVIVFKAADEDEMASVASSASSVGIQTFGRGSVVYETSKETLEAMIHRRF